MKKLLFFILILSACQANDSKKINSSLLKTKENQDLENLNIEQHSNQLENLKTALTTYTDFEKAKKAVWQIKTFLPFSVIKINLIEDQENSSWFVDIEEKNQEIDLGKGTGFFISPKHILTNFHVIQNMLNENTITVSKTKFLEKDKSQAKLKLLKISAIYDLALLESEKPVDYYLDIESETKSPPTEAFLMAYIGNSFLKVRLNYIETLFHTIMRFKRSVYLGDFKGTSGAPLINQKAQVIGINHAGSDETNVAISSLSVKDFLNENNRNCSELTVEECINEEWFFLEELFKEEDKLAQYLMKTGFNYSSWNQKKLALKKLIKNIKALQEVQEKKIKAIQKINTGNNSQISKVLDLLEKYKLAITDYNESLQEFNEI